MSWVNGACGGNGSHSVVERQGEQFVAPVVRLGERRRRRDHTVSMRLHAAAAVDKQAHRHRRIFAGKQLGDLRSSVLENCEGVASQSAHVPAASIRNRRVQNDEFSDAGKERPILAGHRDGQQQHQQRAGSGSSVCTWD